jgi:hypothetical protein
MFFSSIEEEKLVRSEKFENSKNLSRIIHIGTP